MKKNWFKMAILLVILLLGYLFALNGRYSAPSNGFVLDKWTLEAVKIKRSNG